MGYNMEIVSSPKDFKQINNYLGEQVEVEFRDGRIAMGKLVFFNWQQQIIHISDYKIMKPEDNSDGYSKKEGRLYIINYKDWKTVAVP